MTCEKYFNLRRKIGQLTQATKRRLTKKSLEGRTSFRTLQREEGFDKNTILASVHEVAFKAKDSAWIAKNLKPKWDGILSFDGKLIRVYSPYARINGSSFKQKAMLLKQTWLVGVDTKTKDLPHYGLAESENLADLVKYFKALKGIGYPLRALIRDGNLDIERAARIVFEDSFSTQLCLRHFAQSLKRRLKDERKSHKEETECLIRSVKEALEEKNCLEKVEGLIQSFTKKRRITEIQEWILLELERNIKVLTTHFNFKGEFLPYNNDVENLLRQLNLRLKTWGIFGNKENARHYLKTWALFRRFTSFTDCRGRNKFKNGKAPLELAEVNIKGLDYLKLK